MSVKTFANLHVPIAVRDAIKQAKNHMSYEEYFLQNLDLEIKEEKNRAVTSDSATMKDVDSATKQEDV